MSSVSDFTRNAPARELYGRLEEHQTLPGEFERTSPSPLQRRSSPRTEPSVIEADRFLAKNQDLPASAPMPVAVVADDAVQAVIGEVTRDYVVVECRTPSGLVEIQLPPTVVPESLLRYGQPVTVSLDYSSGYRRPRIDRREVGKTEPLPGQHAAEEWLDSL